MRKEYAGAAQGTLLATAISDTDTTIELADATGWPLGTYPFVMQLRNVQNGGAEKILCSARTGTTLTVQTRGYDGTTAQAFNVGDIAEHVIDAESLDNANNHANSGHNYATKNAEGRIYYVDELNGSDSNDGLSEATAFKTLTHAFNQIPDILSAVIVTIRIIGTYSSDAAIYGKKLLGGGRINLTGNSAVRSENIISGRLNFWNFTGSGVALNTVSYSINIDNLVFNSTPYFYECRGANINNCDLVGGTYGAVFYLTDGWVYQCNFGSGVLSYAILSDAQSNITISDCTGTIISYTVYAINNSTIYLGDNGILCPNGPRIRQGGKIYERYWHEVGAANEPAFQNGWGNYSPYVARFRMSGETTFVDGVITGGTADLSAFVLPTGYRPSQTKHISCMNSSTSSYQLRAQSTGNIIPITSTSWQDISCSFIAREI